MKKIVGGILGAFVFLLLAGWLGGAMRVAASDGSSSGALCTVEAHFTAPDLCPAGGLAANRSETWLSGLLPRRQFPSATIDSKLGELDRSYAAVPKDFSLPLYRTVQDAIGNNPDHFLHNGFVYISYTGIRTSGEDKFLVTGNGWVARASDVALSHVRFNQFHGVELSAQPTRPFGWVIPYAGALASREPGALPADDAPFYPWYTFVEVFDSKTVDGVTWYMVDFNRWLPQTRVGLVFPVSEAPEGIPQGQRWFSVNLAEQTLAAYEGGRLVFATLAATGLNHFWTRPGLFQVKNKFAYDSMTGSYKADLSDFYYVEDVPWVMYFSGTRAIHGAYWHNNFGYQHSHGCVNLPVADAHWVFDFAEKGTWVYVFDPTGKTPTDDASYGENSAP